MDPISAGIMAGGSLVSTAMTNSAMKGNAYKQYKYQSALQQQAQQWQEKMSNTAHQREVKDLESAGLNPILSATGGQGVTTGSVGAGSVGMAGAENPNLGDVVNTALSAKLQKKQIEQIDNQMENNDKLTNAQAENLYAEAELNKTNNENAETKTPALENAENFAKTWWGRNVSPVLADVGQLLGGAGAMANAGAGIANAKTAKSLAGAKKAEADTKYLKEYNKAQARAYKKIKH